MRTFDVAAALGAFVLSLAYSLGVIVSTSARNAAACAVAGLGFWLLSALDD